MPSRLAALSLAAFAALTLAFGVSAGAALISPAPDRVVAVVPPIDVPDLPDGTCVTCT